MFLNFAEVDRNIRLSEVLLDTNLQQDAFQPGVHRLDKLVFFSLRQLLISFSRAIAASHIRECAQSTPADSIVFRSDISALIIFVLPNAQIKECCHA